MQLDLGPKFHPFDPAGRPAAAALGGGGGSALGGAGSFGGGGAVTHLSPADLAGTFGPARRARGRAAVDKPAAPQPTGLAALDAKTKAAAAAPAGKHADLEGYAKQLVSQTFFGTMLKQMRESPFKSDLFEGGRGGQAFSGMYDQKMAEQMSRGAGKKLVASIVKKLQAGKAYAKQAGLGEVASGAPVTAGTAANLPAAAATPAAAGVAFTDNHSNRETRTHAAVAHRRA